MKLVWFILKILVGAGIFAVAGDVDLTSMRTWSLIILISIYSALYKYGD